MAKQNRPYVKKFNEFGVLTNPITKEAPYVQGTSQKDNQKVRRANNRRGIGCVVARVEALSFARYRLVKQHLLGKSITHSILVP